MGINVENDSEHGLEPKLSRIKGGPGAQTGGTPSRQSGSPLSPGGECFAPFFNENHHTMTTHETCAARVLCAQHFD